MSDQSRVPVVATPISAVDIAVEIMHAWREILGVYPTRSALALLLAQSALETWRWRSMWNWNLGNVKASGTVDPFYFKACTEVLSAAAAAKHLENPATGEDGRPSVALVRKNHEGEVNEKGVSIETWTLEFRPPHKACAFRSFKTVEEGADFYLRFLRRKYLPAWEYIEAGDARGFVRKLKELFYFTANLEEYAAAVESIHREYMKLDFVLPSEENSAPRTDTIDRAAIDASVAACLQALSWRLIEETDAA